MVYVQDREGRPLMPTKRCGWVAYALKHGEARVVRGDMFTIRLMRDSTRYLQEVTLGVDVGSRHIGLSASTKKEELYTAQAEVRDDVTELLTARREFRIARRGRRHNWYRPARWANRSNERRNKEMPPSIRHKADSHIRAINNVLRILPGSCINVEVGKFDSQRLANPTISGVEYQRGTLAGWENLKAYAKWRDGYKCRVCGKSLRTDPTVHLEVHHIRRRADGGSDTAENVVTLCHECHEAHHKGERKLKFRRPPVRKNEAHMNAMRKYLENKVLQEFPGQTVAIRYGYETTIARREHGKEKSHMTDAFCIAGNFDAVGNGYNVYFHKFERRHNRCLHKATILKGGYRKANQAPREVFGYRLNDVVRYKGKEWFVHGRRRRGDFVLKGFNSGGKAEVSHNRIQLIRHSGTILTEMRNAVPPKSKDLGSFA